VSAAASYFPGADAVGAMRVSVIGGSRPDPETEAIAESVGSLLAERGHGIVCGGLGGVMAAACRGARAEGGHTVGILPGADPRAANPHVETAIATGMGNARNALVVLNGSATIAVGGASGTLSEIGHALDLDRPIAGLDTHDIDGVEAVDSPDAAVAYVETAV